IAGGGYANAHEQVGNLVAPILVQLGAHGEKGYYSSLIVRADSPYHSLADLKGKALAVVDYNSTSGYLMPMHAMRQAGIDP
ncbi:PhnD/SsuA/transferrin family substrate-binding protein, partial [Acinetobacter baumannii]